MAHEYYGHPRFCVDEDCRIDGAGGYPKGERRLEFRWPPVWSADGAQVAISGRDADRSGRRVVVVKSVSGRVDELEIPSEASDYAVLLWDGPELAVESERRRWKMNADRSEFVPITK